MKIETPIRLNYSEDTNRKINKIMMAINNDIEVGIFIAKKCVRPNSFLYCDRRCDYFNEKGKYEIMCSVDGSKTNILDKRYYFK